MAENFDNPYSADLIGLWDFRDGCTTDDTGLGDGIAQDGEVEGAAGFGGGWMLTGGNGGLVVDDGSDDAFDLAQGTIITVFKPAHFGDEPQTVFSRGEPDEPDEPGSDDSGVLELRVLPDGAVQVFHGQGGDAALLTTDAGFAGIGDEIKVSYAWSEGGVIMTAENISTGEVQTLGDDVSGLTLDLTDGGEPSFTIGARSLDGEEAVNGFIGGIDYVAVLDADVVTPELGPDGIVEGTAGDDLIDLAYTGDPEGDMIDAGDAIQPGAAPDDDIVDAGDGDDTVLAGAGNDVIHGGAGGDSLNGGAGNDVISGDTRAPGVAGTESREVFQWDLAPDPDDGGSIDDGDSLSGGFTQNTGSVEVTFTTVAETGGIETGFSDTAQFTGNIDTDGDPADPNSSLSSLSGGDGNMADYKLDFSEPVENASFRISDIDGDGVVKVTALDAEGNEITVNLAGGPGLELSDTDSVAGDDTATSQGGYAGATSPDYSLLVTIPGPVSCIMIEHDQVSGANSGIQVSDVYFDPLAAAEPGEPGNDIIDGGEGDDLVYAGGGDDTIIGGQGDDIFGGEDEDGLDVDVLDLRGAAEAQNPGGSLTVGYDDDDPEAGVVTFFDADGVATGTTQFAEIEHVIPCFTPGTLIATPQGERRVEDLRPGDRVITRDNGIQAIRWAGARTLEGDSLVQAAHLQPILIREGALGNGLPERDMMVSPNHRVLVANDKTALYFEDREVLVAAKHLTGLKGVDAVQTTSVTYIHFMFDYHEVVLSDGAWTESFQPGDQTLRGLDNAQRTEIFELFPELKTAEGRETYAAARRSLKKHEARLLVH